MAIFYVNEATGTIEEVDGSAWLIDLDALGLDDVDMYDAQELITAAKADAIGEEIPW